jgi:hypothetical protein
MKWSASVVALPVNRPPFAGARQHPRYPGQGQPRGGRGEGGRQMLAVHPLPARRVEPHARLSLERSPRLPLPRSETAPRLVDRASPERERCKALVPCRTHAPPEMYWSTGGVLLGWGETVSALDCVRLGKRRWLAHAGWSPPSQAAASSLLRGPISICLRQWPGRTTAGWKRLRSSLVVMQMRWFLPWPSRPSVRLSRRLSAWPTPALASERMTSSQSSRTNRRHRSAVSASSSAFPRRTEVR